MTVDINSPFPPLKNDTIVRAARGDKVDHIPVWLMRQAGRYLPEFRELRSKYDFITVTKNPELACEATLMPIKRYPRLDAAIIFSDILTIPAAMGMELQMLAGEGPHFPDPIRTPKDLEKLIYPLDVKSTLGYVWDALRVTRHALNGCCALIGFAGAPWTLMAYMIEGGHSKNFQHAKRWLFDYPEASHKLLSQLCDVIIEYLWGQVQNGAQLLQIFDSWAGELTPDQFFIYSFPYLKKIATEIRRKSMHANQECVPLIVFARGAHYALERLDQETEYDVISIDWTHDPNDVRKRTSKTLQGNLDPCVLYGSEEYIRQETTKMIGKFGKTKYIANLGHGMHPSHSPESVGFFIDAVHSYKV